MPDYEMYRGARPWVRVAREQEGFTLIEAMVALGVLLAALAALAYTASVGFPDIALAKQRQTATGLANQAMEEVRALPFNTLKTGLDNTDLATSGDTNIVNCGGVVSPYCFEGEQIPHGNNAPLIPLVPHQGTVTLGGIVYTSSVYVTYYQNDSTTSTFRVTVTVSWINRVRPGASSKIRTQTLVNSPTGCLSLSTHPFAAPCQPYFYGSARADEGSIVITGQFADSDMEQAALRVARENGNLQIEQISALQGASVLSGGSLKRTGSDEQSVGRTSVSSSADNDPSQPSADYSSVTAPAQSASTLTVSGGGGSSLTVASSAGDTGSTVSTTSASVSPSHPCANVAGVLQADGLQCGNSKGQQVGLSTMIGHLKQGSDDLGLATFASVAASPTSGVAYVKRLAGTGDGYVHAEATRSFGTVTLAGLPTLVPAINVPAGWLGYITQVTGATNTVSGEAGVGAAKPVASGAGTISYWNGNNYVTRNVQSGNNSAINIGAVHIAYTTLLGDAVVIDISSTNMVDGSYAPSQPDPCGGNPCTRYQSVASASSPILGDILYSVTVNGASLANLEIHVDLGALYATGSYQAAPSA